jgi:four helix bundle protein
MVRRRPQNPGNFIHKMRVSLKELRESRVCMKVIKKRKYLRDEPKIVAALDETEQLIAIFVKSIQTAQKNLSKEKRS